MTAWTSIGGYSERVFSYSQLMIRPNTNALAAQLAAAIHGRCGYRKMKWVACRIPKNAAETSADAGKPHRERSTPCSYPR